jgi:predicted RNA-binding protein
MCEANAYLIKEGSEKLIMESVDIVEPEGSDTWRIVDIFGDQKYIKGRIKGMNLVDHKIIFEVLPD